MEIEMNEKTLYIKNARIVRGDGRVPEAGGVIVSYADGKGTISEIGKVKAPENCSISDAKGAYLFPAFVDIGVVSLIRSIPPATVLPLPELPPSVAAF